MYSLGRLSTEVNRLVILRVVHSPEHTDSAENEGDEPDQFAPVAPGILQRAEHVVLLVERGITLHLSPIVPPAAGIPAEEGKEAEYLRGGKYSAW